MAQTTQAARPMHGPGGPRMGRPRVRVENPGRIAKRLLGEIFKNYGLACVLVVVFILGSTLANVQGTLFMQKLIDDYIKPMVLTGSRDFAPLAAALFRVAGFYAVGIICTYAYNRIMVNVGQGTIRSFRVKLFNKMKSLPIRYFDTHAHGDIMSIYTNDTDTLRQMIGQSMPQFFSSACTVVSVLVSMVILDIPLTLLSLVMVALMLNVVKKLGGRSGSYFVQQQKDLGSLNGYIEEMINGQKVVKVFNHEEKAKENFDERNSELCFNVTNANKYANTLMPLMNGLGYMLYVIIAIVGGILAINGVTNIGLSGVNTLTLGVIASFLQLSRSFCQPIGQVSQQINSVIMAVSGAKRIFELIDEPSEEDTGKITLVNCTEKNGKVEETNEFTEEWAWKIPKDDGSFEYRKLLGEVRLEHVDFSYEKGKQVLHDVTLYAEPGQKVALVGATGAGKTTITNLINHFYDIDSGVITYDGINIKDIRKDDLRRSMGIVLQDVNLFTGTVMENLRYGRLDATDEECIAAAELVNADSFIRMLPQGYNTVLSGDGSGLSQGQRQLISIARAAVADPPVMILDEATSSIDTRTESIVQHGMDALMHGRTVFVIAHRLSTVRNSDVIMVLENGRIIERGNHDKLIAEKGKYYQLYTGAFELE